MIYGVPQTVKADIWSLGCALLDLLDPESFFLGDNFKVYLVIYLFLRKFLINIIFKDIIYCCCSW